jgi:hypothetical protein
MRAEGWANGRSWRQDSAVKAASSRRALQVFALVVSPGLKRCIVLPRY